MLERSEQMIAAFRASLTTGSLCVKLNGAIVPIETARTIMENTKDLKGSKSKIEQIFSKIINGQTNGIMAYELGNNRIEIIKE